MFKKLQVLILLLFMFCFSKAQITKGSLFLGGGAQYTSQKQISVNSTDESKYRVLSIAPAIGIAVKNNLVFGLDLKYTAYKRKYTNVVYQDDKTIGAGLFLRRYVPLGKNFYIFADGRVGVDFINEKNEVANPFTRRKGYNINLAFQPGISYALKNKIHIELGMNNLFFADLTKTKQTGPAVSDNKSTSFNISTSLDNPGLLTAGIRFIL